MGEVFLYVAEVFIKKANLSKDKTYKINYRYDLHRISKKQNKIKVVPESHVTGSDKFTRLLDFRKYGFPIDSKLYPICIFLNIVLILSFSSFYSNSI